jgi:PAS domain-containing protein
MGGPGMQPGDRPAARDSNDQAAVERTIRRSLTSGEPYTADHRIVHPDGGIRWLHSGGRVFLGQNGDPKLMRGHTWDVTDRQARLASTP